ncbi:unnamed protein product, partial [Brenthis ino]
MTIMKTELSEFQTKMSAEINELRNAFEHQKNKCKETSTSQLTPVHSNTLPLMPIPRTNNTKPVEAEFTPTYRDIVRKVLRPRRTKFDHMRTTPKDEIRMLSKNGLSSKSNDNEQFDCDDNFTLVKNKKRKYKINNLRGTCETTGKIRVVESQCSIYVSRAMKSVTVSDIIDHITDMGKQCSNVELLQQFNETSFNSFKVTIPTSKIDTFLDTNFWLAGLVYRRFRERRQPTVLNIKLNG